MQKDFQHFKGNKLTRSERVQKYVIDLIFNTKIPDGKRETSKVWELRHASGVTTIGRLLAQKRRLDMEIAEVICMLHDISSIVNGVYKDHAKTGAKLAKKALSNTRDFTKQEINTIAEAIANHSDKHIYSDNPYVELIKDADVFECSLYENSESGYKLHKSRELFTETVRRINKVRLELGLAYQPIFRS